MSPSPIAAVALSALTAHHQGDKQEMRRQIERLELILGAWMSASRDGRVVH